jgi:hypothetical protein
VHNVLELSGLGFGWAIIVNKNLFLTDTHTRGPISEEKSPQTGPAPELPSESDMNLKWKMYVFMQQQQKVASNSIASIRSPNHTESFETKTYSFCIISEPMHLDAY